MTESDRAAQVRHTPTTSPAARLLRAAGEVVLFALVVLSPWPFASNEPQFESALTAGVLLLIALWAAHAALTGVMTFRLDVVSVSLAALTLWSAAHILPLPESVVGVLSPTRLEWHRSLLPEQAELIPGEDGTSSRPTFLTLSVDPSATRTFLVRVLTVLLVYLAARNWLATRLGFHRLAWVLTGTGVSLTVLALGQLFSSPPGVIYWSIVTEGGVFGPFICRNHYPDYVALCLGLGIGLLLPRGRWAGEQVSRTDRSPAVLMTPRGMLLVGAVGLMAVSIAFSLSRGGILSVVAAGIGAWILSRIGRIGGSQGGGRFALIGAAVVAGGVAAWFGFESIEKRLSTLATQDAVDSRGPIWRDSVRLVPRFWATGTGGETFIWVDPLVRTEDRPAMEYVDHAHNEYLEAAVEGGLFRLAVTLALVVGLMVVVGRGFLRRRDRSVGPLLLGAWFGLAVGAFHSAVDFAIHMPAVAMITAVVAGYAMAAASDPEFVPSRSRPSNRRSVRTPADAPTASEQTDGSIKSSSPTGWTARGWAASGVALALAGLALFAALDSRSRERVHRLKLAADMTYWETGTPDRLARRTQYLDARVAIRPDDPLVLFDAAQGHIDAAVEATLASTTRTTGEVPPTVAPDRFPPDVVSRHLVPALRLLRAARAANSLAPRPHTRLALYADYFARSEPAGVHFDRAKRLLPTDPDLWFASGKDALRRGNTATAWSDWKRSLEISELHLTAILNASREKLPPAEIFERVLPKRPAVLWIAANQLFPDREANAAARRPFLEAAIASPDPSHKTAEHFAAVAQAHDELDHPGEALQAWRRAVELGPKDVAIRDGYSRWLEREERYEEAIPHLEWLRHNSPGGAATVQDRLDAAMHGLKLKRGIGAR